MLLVSQSHWEATSPRWWSKGPSSEVPKLYRRSHLLLRLPPETATMLWRTTLSLGHQYPIVRKYGWLLHRPRSTVHGNQLIRGNLIRHLKGTRYWYYPNHKCNNPGWTTLPCYLWYRSGEKKYQKESTSQRGDKQLDVLYLLLFINCSCLYLILVIYYCCFAESTRLLLGIFFLQRFAL